MMVTESPTVQHMELTKMTKLLRSPQSSPMAKSPMSLPSSPLSKGKRPPPSSLSGKPTNVTMNYEKLSTLLNVSEDELNLHYEEWMRIAADNVSGAILFYKENGKNRYIKIFKEPIIMKWFRKSILTILGTCI
jgi:hypothetical protein